MSFAGLMPPGFHMNEGFKKSHEMRIPTVDGSEIPNNHLGCTKFCQ